MVLLGALREDGHAVFDELVHDEARGDHRAQLDGQVVDVLLHEAEVEQGEVRVEGLDQEKLHHQRVGLGGWHFSFKCIFNNQNTCNHLTRGSDNHTPIDDSQ